MHFVGQSAFPGDRKIGQAAPLIKLFIGTNQDCQNKNVTCIREIDKNHQDLILEQTKDQHLKSPKRTEEIKMSDTILSPSVILETTNVCEPIWINQQKRLFP